MEQLTLDQMEDTPEYLAFVEKFKPKKTTDDCFTPPPVYEAVRDWACQKYGLDPQTIVRPFWPGEDYERFDYPKGCVVLDNPPFSIFSRICEFYLDRGIKFFLFAPSLTLFSSTKTVMKMNHIICDSDIVYENGASVKTAFVTNLDANIIAQSCPELMEIIKESQRQHDQVSLPKYQYPDNVLTASMLQNMCRHGVAFAVKKGDCCRISKLDAQRRTGKAIFGGGLLLSEKVAAQKATAEAAAETAVRKVREAKAAQKAAAIVWELSERERKIIARLGQTQNGK